MKMLFFGALLIAVTLYAALLVSSNSATILLNLPLIQEVETTLWMGVLAAFVSGALLIGLVSAFSILRLRLELRRRNQEIATLEQEVHGLRTMPLEARAPTGQASALKG